MLKGMKNKTIDAHGQSPVGLVLHVVWIILIRERCRGEGFGIHLGFPHGVRDTCRLDTAVLRIAPVV